MLDDVILSIYVVYIFVARYNSVLWKNQILHLVLIVRVTSSRESRRTFPGNRRKGNRFKIRVCVTLDVLVDTAGHENGIATSAP